MTDQAAIYLRVSTDDQEQRFGLPAQLAACKLYAERKDLRVMADPFSDAETGRISDRPGIQRALAAARDHKFTHLILLDHSRLGRSVKVSSQLRAEFESAGVTIHYASSGQSYDPDSEDGILLNSMQDAMSEVEIRRIVRRTRAGRIEAVKDNRLQLGGGVPFGYVRIHSDRRPGGAGQRLEVNATEAALVRRVFDWFLTGENYEEIARRLTRLGAAKHNGFQWDRQDVYAMLRQSAYMGRWGYGRSKMVRGEKVKVPKSEWIWAETPAIIDQETWDRAQVRLQSTTRSYQGRITHIYLLRGRVVCAECGRVYNAHTQTHRGKRGKVTHFPYYMHNFASRDCPNRAHLKVADADREVQEFIFQFVTDPNSKWQDLLEHAVDAQDFIQRQIEGVQKRRAGLDEQIDRAKRAYTEGAFDLDSLSEQVERIEAERTILDQEAERLANEAKPIVIDHWHDPIDPAADAAEFEAEGPDFFDWQQYLDWVDLLDIRLRVSADRQVLLTASIGQRTLSLQTSTRPSKDSIEYVFPVAALLHFERQR